MRHANVGWEEINRKISNLCCNVPLVSAINCVLRAFTGITIKLGLLVPFFFFFKRFHYTFLALLRISSLCEKTVVSVLSVGQ